MQLTPSQKCLFEIGLFRLNFLTILNHFWHFDKNLKKASLGPQKRSKLVLSFIARKIPEIPFFDDFLDFLKRFFRP